MLYLSPHTVTCFRDCYHHNQLRQHLTFFTLKNCLTIYKLMCVLQVPYV